MVEQLPHCDLLRLSLRLDDLSCQLDKSSSFCLAFALLCHLCWPWNINYTLVNSRGCWLKPVLRKISAYIASTFVHRIFGFYFFGFKIQTQASCNSLSCSLMFFSHFEFATFADVFWNSTLTNFEISVLRNFSPASLYSQHLCAQNFRKTLVFLHFPGSKNTCFYALPGE